MDHVGRYSHASNHHHHNMFSLDDPLIDPNSLSPGAFPGAVPTAAASPSRRSPSSTSSIAESRSSSRPIDQLLRPMRWIARRAGVTFRGGGHSRSGDPSGRGTVEVEPSTLLEVEDMVDGLETDLPQVQRERTVSITSALPCRISIQPTSYSAMVQSLSSPGCFSAFDSVM